MMTQLFYLTTRYMTATITNMSLVHNFDENVKRRGTDSKKYDENFFPADVIPMWIADTDFRSPQPVIDALKARIEEGVYGYPSVSSRLKKASALWEKKRFGFAVSPDEVEFVPGVIPGIIWAVRALSNQGDNIVIQTPCYPPFSDLAVHNGRTLLRNSLLLRDGHYEIDFSDLEEKLNNPRSRILILCNPQNPTGRVFTRKELVRLGELCLKYNVFVISDEIHCDITYQGHTHIPFAGISPEFANNSAVFINPSKTFNLPGFRTAAFICRNPRIKAQIHGEIVNNKGIGENICGTLAFCTAYESADYYADQLVDYLEENKRQCEDFFSKTACIDLVKAEGTYLFWLDCRKMNLPQAELVQFMKEKAKIGFSDGKAFGPEGEGFLRMNIACQKTVLKEVFTRLNTAFAV